jgi:hypothetical protein
MLSNVTQFRVAFRCDGGELQAGPTLDGCVRHVLLCIFRRLLCDTFLTWWTRFDDFSRVAIAVSASTSAIAGWALWKEPTFKTAWAVIAGFGVLVAIIHTALGVTYRLRDLSDCRNKLLRLRLDMQTYRMRMVIDPEFSTAQFEAELLRFRERWANECQRRADLLETKWLKKRVQDYLDIQIQQYDESNTGRADH